MINRLLDIPYISDEMIERIETDSSDRFNLLLKEFNCDPIKLLEKLIINNQSDSYEGVWTIINYGLFLSENDFHIVSYEDKSITIKRKDSLQTYLEPLNFQKVALMIFSHFANISEDGKYEQKINEAINQWGEAFPRDRKILEEYKRTKCLDNVLSRMIEIRRRFIYE